MISQVYITNKPREGISKDNYFRELTKLKTDRLTFEMFINLLDKNYKKLPKDVLKHKEIVIDAFLVLNVTKQMGAKRPIFDEYKRYLVDKFNKFINDKKKAQRIIKIVLHNQIKKEMYILTNKELKFTKKADKLWKDLSPFIEHWIA